MKPIPSITLYAQDADTWESMGLSIQEEDAVQLALWRWFRGREDLSTMTIAARCLYAEKKARILKAHQDHEKRSLAGKKGGEARWGFANGNANGCANGNANGCANGNANDKRSTELNGTDTELNRTDTDTYTGSEKGVVRGATPQTTTPTKKRFVKPSVDDIRAYCEAQGIASVDANRFWDYYESKGWKVGNSPMRNWQAAVRNWAVRGSSAGVGGKRPASSVGIVNMSKREEDYGL